MTAAGGFLIFAALGGSGIAGTAVASTCGAAVGAAGSAADGESAGLSEFKAGADAIDAAAVVGALVAGN